MAQRAEQLPKDCSQNSPLLRTTMVREKGTVVSCGALVTRRSQQLPSISLGYRVSPHLVPCCAPPRIRPPCPAGTDVVQRAPVQGYRAVPQEGGRSAGQRARAGGGGDKTAGQDAVPHGRGEVSPPPPCVYLCAVLVLLVPRTLVYMPYSGACRHLFGPLSTNSKSFTFRSIHTYARWLHLALC